MVKKLLGVMVLVVIGCKDGDELSLGISSPDGVYTMDTVSIRSTTVRLDSLTTSGTGIQLVGKYSDTYLGNLESQSYFQVGIADEFPSDEGNVYDSIALFLHYQRYWYGDTNSIYRINLTQVIEDFEPDEGSSFYNTSNLKTESEPWAAYSFTPRPLSQDSIVMPVSDDLGKLFFEHLVGNSSQSDFLEDFPGFRLSVSESESVIGFLASAEVCYFELYYHQQSEVIETATYQIKLINESNQFNNISSDIQVIPLENLDSSQPSSGAQEHKLSHIQAGTGIITKLEFPHLYELINNQDIFLMEASLLIRPTVSSSDNVSPYPENLILSETDEYNDIGAQLTVDYGTQLQVASLQSDPEFGANNFYRFSLTEYLEKQLYQDGGNHGLLVTLPWSEFSQSVHKLSIGNNENSDYTTELTIIYLYTK